MKLKLRLKGKQEATDLSPAQTPGTFQGPRVSFISYFMLVWSTAG